MKTKIYYQVQFITAMFFLCLLLGIPFMLAYSQYLPPPPPPPQSAIRYAPQKSTNSIPPPPGGWSRTTPQKTFSPPTPPLDPKLKNFPLDLDLLDFAEWNPFQTQHCFFSVKGRKDVIEFIPNQQGGIFMFPTGTCHLEDQKCYIGERQGRLPGMKKTDPPIYAGGLGESSYNGFPVIPYKYADDINFSKCVPSWTGYFEADDYKVYLYKPPKRDYTKQNCYHPRRGLTMDKKSSESVFCDKEKCQLTENQYCENKTGQCYLNGYPLKNQKGQSVTTDENYLGIIWDFCADKNGTLIPDDGGQPYEERFKPGCSYRIEAPNYHEKQYAGNIDFLIKCDENRCYGGGLEFDMKRKEYVSHYVDEETRYSKTPPFTEFLTINWQCLDATKVRDYNKKLLCTLISSDQKNPDCRLCYENKKFIYKGCRVP